MRTDLAFALGEAFRDNPQKVFDWTEAVYLIKRLGLKNAWAGLKEDWFWTGGKILEDGKPFYDGNTFLASTWATPILVTEDDIAYECWCYDKECEWNSGTRWPKSALSLMEEDNELSN